MAKPGVLGDVCVKEQQGKQMSGCEKQDGNTLGCDSTVKEEGTLGDNHSVVTLAC